MFLEIWQNSQGKHLCQYLFFNKVAGKETLAQVFSFEFREISKNTFSYRITPAAASVLLVNHDICTVNSMYCTTTM